MSEFVVLYVDVGWNWWSVFLYVYCVVVGKVKEENLGVWVCVSWIIFLR